MEAHLTMSGAGAAGSSTGSAGGDGGSGGSCDATQSDLCRLDRASLALDSWLQTTRVLGRRVLHRK